mgnify:CR=1 FL=1
MKEITKNQATAIWQIFFVLWLTVGSIVCFNIHCITSEPPIYAPMFAITPLYLIEFYFDHPYTVQAILFQNFVLILMPALLWFLTYKSVFKNKKYRKHNHSYDYDSRHRFVQHFTVLFFTNRIFFLHPITIFLLLAFYYNQFNNKNRINFCNG